MAFCIVGAVFSGVMFSIGIVSSLLARYVRQIKSLLHNPAEYFAAKPTINLLKYQQECFVG